MVAAEIDRIEREFIFKTAVDTGIPFRFHAPGRTSEALLEGFDKEALRFQPLAGGGRSLRGGERVAVNFSLHGQAFAFGGLVWKSGPRTLEIRLPEAIYRSLARRWPRVPEPTSLRAEILVPEGAAPSGYPTCAEYSGIEEPGTAGGLDLSSLDTFIKDFRKAATRLSGSSRLRMLKKGEEPADPLEEITAALGRSLFVPSTWGRQPRAADPWDDGRLISPVMVEDYEGIASLGGDAYLAAHLRSLADEGVNSLIVSPVIYYRSVIAFVSLVNGPGRPRPLEIDAVELAWNFSRGLAWFLKRHDYYKSGTEGRPENAEVLDASPAGLQVALGPQVPLLHTGASFDLTLTFPKGRLPCKARVKRRLDEEGRARYGLSLEGLTPSVVDALALGFYGNRETFEAVQGLRAYA